jgi:hypothetical protein
MEIEPGPDCAVSDFHATRHTFISGIVAGNASVKTAQELARHSTPVLTIGKNAHARRDDLHAALNTLPDLDSPKTRAQHLRSSRETISCRVVQIGAKTLPFARRQQKGPTLRK